ncbi:tetratricopeptide repeat protein [Gaetbulibacter saemankumensis]|uniref:hypothetical protein n=1 Tax=Gaetbulibacter saemankumensis TaxID=311208 RepID=UPI0004145582|nr:hypothetical protein [Gaetbulibacter saemankumensis]
MKTKITLLLAVLFVGLNVSFAQQDQECLTKLSIFHEYVKSKNFEAAYEPWMLVRNKCPKFHSAIYVDGEKILESKIDKVSGEEQVAVINDLLLLWEQRAENFPNKTAKGEFLAKACQLKYDFRDALNLSKEELYACFDEAYNTDKKTFSNPKSLYTYFSLMVDLYDAGKKPAEDLFNKYDDVVEKVESEIENYSLELNDLVVKEDAGGTLTKKEASYKRSYESYLRAYDQIASSIDSKLGDRANCENLVPLYKRGFEENKTNAVWLKRAAAKMAQKECTDDPMFFDLVNAFHELDPSADSAYYLGILKDKEGKSNDAISFYEQALSLESDGFKKAKLYKKIGLKLKSKGSYVKARNYFRQALSLNPSDGSPHLYIAAMYAASANDCGDTAFNKRAVYWLAADEAAKAGRVDPTQKKHAAQSIASYKAKAPSKSDVFSSGTSGQQIKIGCWINAVITVPSI